MDAIQAAISGETPPAKTKRLLKVVKVVNPVSFAGPADMTMLAKDGELELDLEHRLVLGTPNVSTREPCIVPLENVVFMVPLDPGTARKLAEVKAEAAKQVEQAAAAKVAQVAAQQPRPAAHPPGYRPPKPKGDTVKFIRGPDGKPIEVVE